MPASPDDSSVVVGWDKETATGGLARANCKCCELYTVYWAKLLFPTAHQELRHAGPTLPKSSGLAGGES